MQYLFVLGFSPLSYDVVYPCRCLLTLRASPYPSLTSFCEENEGIYFLQKGGKYLEV